MARDTPPPAPPPPALERGGSKPVAEAGPGRSLGLAASHVRVRPTPPSEEQAPHRARLPLLGQAPRGRAALPRSTRALGGPRSATGPIEPQATPGRGAAASCRPQSPRGSNHARPSGTTSRSGSRAATHGARSQDRGPEAAGR